MKFSTRILPLGVLSLTLLGGAFAAQAGVVVTGTRIIYPANQHDVSVQLSNIEKVPSLVQSWIDSGDAKQDPTHSTAPFLVTPPTARIDGGKKQIVRLTYLPSASVPQDRESVFWFNMLDVPAQNKNLANKNNLQIALRTRIKIFYRPDNLPGTPEQAAKSLHWQTVKAGNGYVLRAINSSAYSVSMSQISVTSGGKKLVDDNGGMVPAKSTVDFAIKGLNSSAASHSAVGYVWISDYGRATPEKSTVE